MNLVGASIRVVNRVKATTGKIVCDHAEFLFSWGSTRVLDTVVASDIDKRWEALFTLLANIDAVPDALSIGVQYVVEAALLILDVDGLS